VAAVDTILRIVDVFRRYGVPVTFEPGWDTRGNGHAASYVGGLIHHTATPLSDTRPQVLLSGRPDLPPPLTNLAGLAGGGIHVCAAHPANHAGASGGYSMGPLPIAKLFNPRVVGLEIVYPGVSPMTAAQYRTACVFAVAIKDVFGRPSMEWTRAHAETSVTGKWDPGYASGKTIDMAKFRADAASLAKEDDMNTVQDALLRGIHEQLTGSRNPHEYPGFSGLPAQAPGTGTVTEMMAQVHDLLVRLLGPMYQLMVAGADVDEAAVAEALRPVVASVVGPIVHAAVREALGDDNDELAESIVARIGQKLSF
jgi:hypothetical protein